eukprot:3316684-Prorocentrum_lima.AAC.1
MCIRDSLISEGVDITGFLSTASQFERLRNKSYDDTKLLTKCGKRLQKILTDLTTKISLDDVVRHQKLQTIMMAITENP